jgi:hypothetical protein
VDILKINPYEIGDTISMVFKLLSEKGEGDITPSTFKMTHPLNICNIDGVWTVFFIIKYEKEMDLYYLKIGENMKNLDGEVYGFFLWYFINKNDYMVSADIAPKDKESWKNLVVVPVSICKKIPKEYEEAMKDES